MRQKQQLKEDITGPSPEVSIQGQIQPRHDNPNKKPKQGLNIKENEAKPILAEISRNQRIIVQ